MALLFHQHERQQSLLPPGNITICLHQLAIYALVCSNSRHFHKPCPVSHAMPCSAIVFALLTMRASPSYVIGHRHQCPLRQKPVDIRSHMKVHHVDIRCAVCSPSFIYNIHALFQPISILSAHSPDGLLSFQDDGKFNLQLIHPRIPLLLSLIRSSPSNPSLRIIACLATTADMSSTEFAILLSRRIKPSISDRKVFDMLFEKVHATRLPVRQDWGFLSYCISICALLPHLLSNHRRLTCRHGPRILFRQASEIHCRQRASFPPFCSRTEQTGQ